MKDSLFNCTKTAISHNGSKVRSPHKPGSHLARLCVINPTWYVRSRSGEANCCKLLYPVYVTLLNAQKYL